jgi:hypothetical protein
MAWLAAVNEFWVGYLPASHPATPPNVSILFSAELMRFNLVAIYRDGDTDNNTSPRSPSDATSDVTLIEVENSVDESERGWMALHLSIQGITSES